MKGDYYRYMCEMLTGDQLKHCMDNTTKCYNAAEKLNVNFGAPTRLSLSLNMAVF